MKTNQTSKTMVAAIVLLCVIIAGIILNQNAKAEEVEVNLEDVKQEAVYDFLVYNIKYDNFATVEELRDIDAHIEYVFERTDEHAYCNGTSGECELYENCVLEIVYNTTQGEVTVHCCHNVEE